MNRQQTNSYPVNNFCATNFNIGCNCIVFEIDDSIVTATIVKFIAIVASSTSVKLS